MGYSTKIRLKKDKSSRAGSKIYSSKSWQSSKKNAKKRKWKRLNLGRFKKAFYFGGGVLAILLFVGLIYGFSWIQALTESLPSIDKPFGTKAVATEILDRNGNLLYRVYDEADRDLVAISDVPFLVKLAVITAEDKDFYKHGGVDVMGYIRCALKIFGSAGADVCGASTIDQQLIKLTSTGNMDRYTRKVAEAIMALQMEKKYSKDQILEMYLTVVPEGSNIYGITRGAKVYFGKELKDLTLAQMAILAAIPNNPNNLSPRTAPAVEAVKERQLYVLEAMNKNIDSINARYREETGKNEDILTKEMIEQARAEELVYLPFSDKDKIKAPHFVFYVQKLLQERGYNNGVPYTREQLETSGLKIYTSLDSDYQAIAEEQVRIGVDKYGKPVGGENASLVALDPKTGEVLAMVGSKDYWGEEVPKGCSGSNCKFSGKVNIAETLQSPGSSMKPMFYYLAFQKGIISPGSIIPDFPIKIGNYKPKNYEGGYYGPNTARYMLKESRNIPPIYLVNYMGIENSLNLLRDWGYTSCLDTSKFGAAIAIGGCEIKLIEHAQAYSVLANQGYYTEHEVVRKIVDSKGEVVFEYKPELKLIADPKAAYLVNDILNGRKGGPGWSLKGRDVAGKTGTSDGNTETLYATYTPEIVVVGWLGNNDNNARLSGSANGFGTARPWIAGFYHRIEDRLKGEPFVKPAGVISSANCSAAEGVTCTGGGSDLSIAGYNAPGYLYAKTAVVCVDQPGMLARPIDIALGKSITITVKEIKAVDPSLQGQLDAFMTGWFAGHLDSPWGPPMPTTNCTINRNPLGEEKPWVEVSSPLLDGLYYRTMLVKANGYSIAGTVTSIQITVGSVSRTFTGATVDESIDISALSVGSHTVTISVLDSTGSTGTSLLSIMVSSPPTPTITRTPVVPTITVTPKPSPT